MTNTNILERIIRKVVVDIIDACNALVKVSSATNEENLRNAPDKSSVDMEEIWVRR